MQEIIIDKYDREFPSKEAFNQFLQHADIVGKWEQKHNRPEAKRLTWWHSDYGVHVPNYWVAKSEIAEKFNEIAGRQMQPELDPLFELKSSSTLQLCWHGGHAGRG